MGEYLKALGVGFVARVTGPDVPGQMCVSGRTREVGYKILVRRFYRREMFHTAVQLESSG